MTRLDRAHVERSIAEMWDAMARTNDPEGTATSEAHAVERTLRDALAAQDRLDEAAPGLLAAAKRAVTALRSPVDFELTVEALEDLSAAISAAEGVKNPVARGPIKK